MAEYKSIQILESLMQLKLVKRIDPQHKEYCQMFEDLLMLLVPVGIHKWLAPRAIRLLAVLLK